MSFLESKIRSTLFVSVAATGVALIAPSMAEASFGDNTLRQGMENSEVKQLQERLIEKGHFKHHTATGYFGDLTREAVVTFQKANKLTQDGIVGRQTFGALSGSTSTSNSSSSTSNSSSNKATVKAISNTKQVMRQGTSNSDVTSLQAYLKKAGFYEGSTSGKYGAPTVQAVRKFQQARSLTVDGLAGPNTLARINAEINNTSTTKKSDNTDNKEASKDSNVSSSLSNVVLRQGSRGDKVRSLQTRLKDLGFLSGSADGVYGPQTSNAVKSLQRQAKIGVDGIFGPNTFKQLETIVKKDSNTSTESKPTGGSSGSIENSKSNGSNASHTLKEGSTGSNVVELQNMLRAIGHLTGRADGQFGPQTKSALVKFQKDWKLVSDGIATKSTWDKLQEVSSIHKEESGSSGGSGSSNTSFNTINLVADAGSYIGVPYVWGGTTANGFDCSGFIQNVFKKNGVTLPRTVALQWNATKSVSTPKVGDIVYFETYTKGPSHNGIYIGNNQFIHSGSSTGVTITSMDNSYWKPRYLGARRAS
ncbi:glycoside hydrolase [Salipaludibacillus neizhouensis]|uniref:Glycoside hydrolase n=1 Tax=Salipaludibacillus neizhouensis TaxID=885475 RepID=A0A3A9K4Q8_9BACI|nr:peptidoglycan-binding protein [Salipaludibacillus neizhouensis]RKL68034.1 glycoside hydrolase [Salipaludibacillus neizhouensis]